jgi:hypothetical protein
MGEQRAQEVHMVKGELISYPLPEGFVALIELLGLRMSYFIVDENFGCLSVACRTCSGYESTSPLGV